METGVTLTLIGASDSESSPVCPVEAEVAVVAVFVNVFGFKCCRELPGEVWAMLSEAEARSGSADEINTVPPSSQ